ncbi:MAG: DUF4446 family protein [Clostridium sp.]
MERFLEIIQEYDTLIMIGIMVLLLVLILIQIINKIQLSRLNKRYKKLFRNSKKENIESMIVEYGIRVEEVLEYTRNVHKAYKGIDDRITSCTQKVGIVRYKAFDDIGSDLSFSVSLLDESDTGVILTGIYGRSESTVFAKPIDNGISKYDLSEEEKEAMERAHKSYMHNNRYRMDNIDDISDVREYKPATREACKEDDFKEAAYDEIDNSEDIKG